MSSIRRTAWTITTLGLAVILCFAGGCSRPEPNRSVSSRGHQEAVNREKEGVRSRARRAWDMVTQAERRVETLDVEAVAKEQAAGVTIVDLRETEERLAHGTIPGAVHAPRGKLEFWADPTSPVHRPEFDPSRRYILFCAVGGRSALAAATLMDMGYTKVAQLEGGFASWPRRRQTRRKSDGAVRRDR